METEFYSVLQFNDYKVDFFQFDRNPDANPEDEDNVDLSFTSSIRVNSEKDAAQINITCTIYDEDFKVKGNPFYLKISITGMFTCEGNIDSLEVNAFAILLPYVRSTITSFTALAGVTPIILPLINVKNLLSQVED